MIFVIMSTKNIKPRGRPRRFDPQEAVATAQALFHERGYDAVSVSDVTKALGINPPSFYAAFDSKSALFSRVLDRWSENGAIPLSDILRDDRPVADALAHLLEEAARRYADASGRAGCLVIEGTRSNDPEAREAACAFNRAAEKTILDYVAARHPQDAERVTNFVSTVMCGLSAKARSGHTLDQLLETARIASSALASAIPSEAHP